MINRILMELYDDYKEGNLESLKDFAKKTFPSDGTDRLFIGCTLIMFSRVGIYKERYYCTREHLLSIVLAAKEKIGDTNLLSFYMDRINTKKNIKKYFGKVLEEEKIDQYADLLIDYLEQFKPDFIHRIYDYHEKIEDYLNHKNIV